MIRMIDGHALAACMTARYGISFRHESGIDTAGSWVDIIPSELLPSHGFKTRVRKLLGGLQVEFVPGPFAAGLVKVMGEAESDARRLSSLVAASAIDEGGQVSMTVNDSTIDSTDPSTWPELWRQATVSIRKLYATQPPEDPPGEPYLKWCHKLMGMVLYLLPVECVLEEDAVSAGQVEGTVRRVEANRYERSPANRAMCIEAHGCKCESCGFDFAEVYGSLGEGYIHVHHVIPVSQMGDNYAVDPLTDLVPVCPNCHAMLHTSAPPLSTEELQTHVETSRGAGETDLDAGQSDAAIAEE